MNDDFLGRGWGFPPEFDKEYGGVRMVSDEEDIQESLKILFNTSMGERVMLPNYGCNIREFLFENADTSRVAFLRDMISNAILKYESRIKVDDILIDVDNISDGVILITVAYTITITNNRNNIVYPFYLNEGTLLFK
ncbi:MAG: GPW/gp25 family protein [Bacteroidota bacterium]|nr:GPW/gp25 family protein [Bacteroidota bacterium]MCA6442125.1 GPW/gp25 family protein [Bacteroidota bacterium]